MNNKTAQTPSNNLIVHKLSNPRTIDGVEYKEVTLNFDEMNGNDIITAEFDMASAGQMVAGLAEYNKTYLMYISARAAKLPIEVLKQFSVKDISAITRSTQGFLMS